MTVLIIDDEADARLILKQYLSDFPQLQLVAECTDGLSAVTAIDQHEPDLIFLDIQMPGLSGFQVLQRIVHVPQVIFTTAYDRYALKAFDHNAIDYLLKPYTRERFGRAVNKVLLGGPAQNLASVRQLTENLPTESLYLTRVLVEQGHKMVALPIENIAWIAADGDYTRLHTSERFYLSSSSMAELESKLPPTQFVRIHRSAIINAQYLQAVERDANGLYAVLTTGLRHKVSRSYQEVVKGWMV